MQINQHKVMDKIFETNSNFQGEIVHYGKSSISIFKKSFSFLEEDWTLGYNSMEFCGFSGFS